MIIGLCGPAGSGKDTAADFLVKNHGFVKVAFADPLKRICKDVFNFTDEQLWGPSEKRNAPDLRYPRFPEEERLRLREQDDCPPLYLTPRFALQQLGTEWGRHCYQDVWVDYALRVARQVLDDGVEYYPTRGTSVENADVRAKGVVISDVRFKNEVRAINAAGGAVILVKRPTTLEGAAATHLSETEFSTIPADYFSFTLENDGTLEQLERAVDVSLAWVRDK